MSKAAAAKWNSIAYWEERAITRMNRYLRDSDETLRVIGGAYRETTRSIEKEIESIWNAYIKAYDLTPEEAMEQLSKPASRAEYERLLREIKRIPDTAARKALEARASSGAYSYRISRLEALRENIRAQVTRLTAFEAAAVGSSLRTLAKSAYMRTIYDIQKGTGLAFSFARMNTRAVEQILKNPWSGKTFSARIWKNGEKLTKILNEKLTDAFTSGKDLRKLAREFMDEMGVSYRNAERLVRTEFNYVANQAELQSLIECEVEQYQYCATLDDRTSEVCADLDGEIFDIKSARVGENMPPMHPRCRSIIVGWFGRKALEGLTRRAKNPKTGEVEKIPRDMKYREWEKGWAA